MSKRKHGSNGHAVATKTIAFVVEVEVLASSYQVRPMRDQIQKCVEAELDVMSLTSLAVNVRRPTRAWTRNYYNQHWGI